MARFSSEALMVIEWFCGQSRRNGGATYAKFALWASKKLPGGQDARDKAWREMYDAHLVDTLHPNDSYMIRW